MPETTGPTALILCAQCDMPITIGNRTRVLGQWCHDDDVCTMGLWLAYALRRARKRARLRYVAQRVCGVALGCLAVVLIVGIGVALSRLGQGM